MTAVPTAAALATVPVAVHVTRPATGWQLSRMLRAAIRCCLARTPAAASFYARVSSWACAAFPPHSPAAQSCSGSMPVLVGAASLALLPNILVPLCRSMDLKHNRPQLLHLRRAIASAKQCFQLGPLTDRHL